MMGRAVDLINLLFYQTEASSPEHLLSTARRLDFSHTFKMKALVASRYMPRQILNFALSSSFGQCARVMVIPQ